MKYLLLFLATVGIFFYSLTFGRFDLSYADFVRLFWLRLSGELGEDLQNASFILFETRLPRAILAIFAGAALGMSGASFQAIFKNPLASPDILGVSSGCAFGAILALMLGLNLYLLTAGALIFGILTLALTLAIAKGAGNAVMIILSGIIVSALFSSLISLLKYIADPQDVLPTITYWLLGSLQVSELSQLVFCCLGMSVGGAILFFYRWKHNLLMLDDIEAASLGLNVKVLRIILIFASTLMVSCVVSICGIISWIGIIIPHISRLICGSNTARILPTSIFIGAIFMLIIDTLSRSLSSEELPISILSAVCGAGVFLIILYRAKGVRI